MAGGRVEAIYVASNRGQAMQPMDAIQAEAGRGLDGDRYRRAGEGPQTAEGIDREVTLIEAEAVEAVVRGGLSLEPGETRRNIVTRGVALNHLVGRAFRLGGVELRGIRLCEPCGHLEKMTRPGVLAALVHRGGLRAQILSGGEIRVGDAFAAAPES
jgi:MOSC domain-containing protein YiiM